LQIARTDLPAQDTFCSKPNQLNVSAVFSQEVYIFNNFVGYLSEAFSHCQPVDCIERVTRLLLRV
jgi:hypothetical protein